MLSSVGILHFVGWWEIRHLHLTRLLAITRTPTKHRTSATQTTVVVPLPLHASEKIAIPERQQKSIWDPPTMATQARALPASLRSMSNKSNQAALKPLRLLLVNTLNKLPNHKQLLPDMTIRALHCTWQSVSNHPTTGKEAIRVFPLIATTDGTGRNYQILHAFSCSKMNAEISK